MIQAAAVRRGDGGVDVSWLFRLALFLAFALLAYGWLRRGLMRLRSERRELTAARNAFGRERARLAEAFLLAARAAEGQRGWRGLQLDREAPLLARDLATTELVSLAGVEIEDDASSGTAVFYWRSGRWTTEGGFAEGLTPRQTLERYQDTLEPL